MKRYNDYSSYLKTKYGCRVYRIGLDAGFTCPNRDGTKGSGGCIYCSDTGSRSPYADPLESPASQLRKRIDYLSKNKGANKFIAYFQAFTNTYADTTKLKTIYDTVLDFKEIVGISIGTRPDMIDNDKLEMISAYKDNYEVWLEYGLQSSHDKTLRAINRGHTFKEFAEAAKLTKDHGILTSAHVIIGLPGETREDIITTARRLDGLKIDGVKIHSLHVLKTSPLESLFRDGKIKMLGMEEYAGLVCDFLENISEDIIVQRLTGQGQRGSHVAPEWALDKTATLAKIDEVFRQRGSRQGSKSRFHS
jgi:hypothetical protein